MVSVEIIDDDLIEHDEDFYLAVKGRGRTVFGRAIIIDDDTPGPPVHVSNPVVPEGEGPIPASRVRFLSPSRIRRMARVPGPDRRPLEGEVHRTDGAGSRACEARRLRGEAARLACPIGAPRPRGPPS